MKRLAPLFLLLLVASPAWPQQPILPTPPVPPLPPAPATTKLLASELYVIRHTAPCIVLASPQGFVRITPDTGPLKIRGLFVGGGGVMETKLFSEKYLYFVEAVATGRAELFVIPQGGTDKDVLRVTLDAIVGPVPPDPKPPVPPGPDPPGPKPDPAPIPVAGLRVLIVFETAEATKMPAAQQSILYGKAMRDYLNSVCVMGPDGKTKEFRIYDKDVVLSGESKLWQDVMKRPRASVPWLVVSNYGKGGFEIPLPATVAEAMAIIKRFE